MRTRRLLGLSMAALLALALGACEETPTEVDVSQSSASMMNSNAPFPVFQQGFNHDTEGWIDESIEGALGWCGTIEQVDRRDGDLKPSSGRGYATVEHGDCNDFWDDVFPGGSPASLDPDLLSTTWPASGWIQQLDIHLDPDEADAGLVFLYANAICILEDGTCPTSDDDADVFDFRYFGFPVLKNGGNLLVAGHPVDEAGWYTFRHIFDSDVEGNLTVDFQLVKNGQPLVTVSIDADVAGAPTSDLEVEDLGSGYILFGAIADGLELPIDEHILRPGR